MTIMIDDDGDGDDNSGDITYDDVVIVTMMI